MSYTVTDTWALGSANTGKAIGYALYDDADTLVQAFTTVNVEELPTPGTYWVRGGLVLPTGFTGRVDVGTSGAKLLSYGRCPMDGEQANLNMAQAVPTSNTADTVGDALNAARAQGFGAWTIVGDVLTLFASDGITAVRTFTLAPPLGPYVSRT